MVRGGLVRGMDRGLYLEGRMLRFLFQMSLEGGAWSLQRCEFLCSKVFLAGVEEWLADPGLGWRLRWSVV